MKSAPRRGPVQMAVLCLLIAGCQKPLDFEKSFKLEPGAVQAFPVDAPRTDQKLTVEANTEADAPLSIYVVKAQDEQAATQALLDGNKPTNALAKFETTKKTGTVRIAFDAQVPAKTAFTVLVGGAIKSCQVKLKLTGR